MEVASEKRTKPIGGRCKVMCSTEWKSGASFLIRYYWY